MSEKVDPIVPAVLYVAEQHHPWQLAPIERLPVQYHTTTTVFLAFGTIDWTVEPMAGRRGVSKQHYHVWCLPDEAAWERVQLERAAFQAAIDALAAQLRRLGRYPDRLAEAGGVARAPNPLTPTVISAPDPDVTPKNWFTTRPVPQLVRRVLLSHTSKMLRCQSSYNPEIEQPHHQRDHFVCPTDADWEGVLLFHQAALEAEQRWNELLGELGTYRDALADGRYTDRVGAVAVQAEIGEQPPTNVAPLIESYRVDETDLDADLLGQLQAAGYRWSGAKRTPDGRWHHVVTLGTQGFRARRERLLALITPAANAALAPAPQAVAGVVMMDVEEAREMIAAMRGDLDEVDRSLASFRQRALEFADRQGWKALGYSGALEAINAELGTHYSKSYLSRLLGAARIERILELPIGNSVPESQLRPMADLDTPDQQRAAWERANEIAGEKPRTAQHVQQAVTEITFPSAERTPGRPNAPAGWVWRDNDSLCRIADSVIVGPYARLADVVSAAEQIEREEASRDAEHIAAAQRIVREAPKWNESEQMRLYQEAYSHVREVRDLERRQALFTEIDQAIDRLQAPAPVTMTVVSLTPEARDADGPWFWASKSAAHPTAHHWRARPTERGRYVSACGLEVDGLPVTGAQAGHCSVCERHADRRETIAIPLPAGVEATPDQAPTTDASRVAALRNYLEQQRKAGLIYRAETADTAWRMASDIHDGDTFRSMAREIDRATSREHRPAAPATVAADLPPATELPSNASLAIQDEELIAPSAGSEIPDGLPIAAPSPTPASIPITVYAPAVTLLTAIRTALLTNQGGQALSQALELVRVLADGLGEAAELDDATRATLVAYQQACGVGEGRVW